MKLTIEVTSQSELEKIMLFFQTLKLDSVRIISDKIKPNPKRNSKKEMKLTKGDKSLDPTELFGIWENNPRSVDVLRQQAWQRNTNL